MQRKVDVLIVGGGVVGVCAAHFLAHRGRRVTLVEKGQICTGSSYGNAGLIVPSHSMPLAAPGMVGKGLRWMFNPESPFYIKPRLDRDLLRWLWHFYRAATKQRAYRAIGVIRDLSLRSRELYDNLASIEDLEFAFERKGMVMVGRSQAILAEVVEEGHLMREAGLQVEVLSAEQVRKHVGAARIEVEGGVFYPQDAHLVPALFVRELAKNAALAGVEFLENTEVLDLRAVDNQVEGVCTTRGEFGAREVIIASGSWSSALGERLGLRLPIQPAKGYSITFKRPSQSPALPLLLADVRVGLTPMGDMLRFGGTIELAGMDFSINQRRVDAILRGVPLFLPDLNPDDLELLEVWRGLRPCTPDGLPLLGRSRQFGNLTIAAGHAMIGMSMGPVTGELVADIVDNRMPSLDISPLAPERFSRDD